jgi:hypothetical protein
MSVTAGLHGAIPKEFNLQIKENGNIVCADMFGYMHTVTFMLCLTNAVCVYIYVYIYIYIWVGTA